MTSFKDYQTYWCSYSKTLPIADKFAKVSKEYEPLKIADIDIPDLDSDTVPVFKQEDIQNHLEKVKLKKAVPPGDLPPLPLVIRKFAKQISIPLCDINEKMILNQKKTMVMIFNFTDKYKFKTNLNLNDENLEVVKQAKLLGVMISDDLKWDKNTDYLVKKAYSRME